MNKIATKFFKIALLAAVIISPSIAEAKSCEIKAVNDPIDGKIYYDDDHRLFKYVKIKKSKGDKVFCSTREARNKGFKKAPYHFSNSTARVVKCIEGRGRDAGSCAGYVMGIYKSLDIYDKICAPESTSNGEVISAFINNARENENVMDIEKYYGTTKSLMAAFPCKGQRVARK